MRIDGRAENLEDFLVNHKSGQWFTWSDTKNKIYANIVTFDGSTKPTEAECTAGLKSLQDSWDAENDSYKSKRRTEYPSTADQLDDIYHNGIDGWKTTIKAIKDKHPKS